MKRRRRPVTPAAVYVSCTFCHATNRSRPSRRFYFGNLHGICEDCIVLFHDLLEDDLKTVAPPSPQRPTPRLTNVELQQVTSPP